MWVFSTSQFSLKQSCLDAQSNNHFYTGFILEFVSLGNNQRLKNEQSCNGFSSATDNQLLPEQRLNRAKNQAEVKRKLSGFFRGERKTYAMTEQMLKKHEAEIKQKLQARFEKNVNKYSAKIIFQIVFFFFY